MFSFTKIFSHTFLCDSSLFFFFFYLHEDNPNNISYHYILMLGSVHEVCRRGSRRVSQILQKKNRSPEEHRPKYFMAQ